MREIPLRTVDNPVTFGLAAIGTPAVALVLMAFGTEYWIRGVELIVGGIAVSLYAIALRRLHFAPTILVICALIWLASGVGYLMVDGSSTHIQPIPTQVPGDFVHGEFWSD